MNTRMRWWVGVEVEEVEEVEEGRETGFGMAVN
jgi:hypothetical protein